MAQSAYFDAFKLSKYAIISPDDGKLHLAVGNCDSTAAQISNNATEKKLRLQIHGMPIGTEKTSLQATFNKLQEEDKAIIQSRRDEIFTILKKYYPELKPDQFTFDTKNPFFIIEANGLRASSSASLSSLSSAVSAVGGLDVTNIADGVAKFLIKRGKQELSIAFFQKFKKVMANNVDLNSLFPTTYPLLDAIDAEIYNYSAYMQNLREAFKSDISALPKNLPALVNNHPDIFNKHPELEVYLLGGCYLTTELENHSHPGDILANFPPGLLDKIGQMTDDRKYLKPGIQTLQLFSDALINSVDESNTSYWVSPDQLKTLLRDKKAFRIFLGLIDQNAKLYYDGIQFNSAQTFSSLLETAGDLANGNQPIIDSYGRYLTSFIGQANELSKQIKDDQSLPADSVAIAKYAAYFKSVIKLIEKASDAGNLQCLITTINAKPISIYTALGSQDFHLTLKPYFDVSYNLADLVTAISGKNYSAAINNAVIIYQITVVNGSKDVEAATTNDEQDKKVDATLKQLNKDTGKPVPAAIKKEIINSAAYPKVNFSEFVKYTSFMAAVATAKNSDDVENAIEAAALPAGSYTIKQKSIFNISLNAYVGYAWDFDKINIFKSGNLYANGIYAPIGFSGSLGGKKGNGAVSIFASLIDVGSLVSYNLGADSVKKLKQSIRLESIVSPSAQLFYEIPGVPLTIGAGWRRTPKLFFSNDVGFKTVDPRNVFNVSILIDIPLFTFYNKTRSQ